MILECRPLDSVPGHSPRPSSPRRSAHPEQYMTMRARFISKATQKRMILHAYVFKARVFLMVLVAFFNGTADYKIRTFCTNISANYMLLEPKKTETKNFGLQVSTSESLLQFKIYLLFWNHQWREKIFIHKTHNEGEKLFFKGLIQILYVLVDKHFDRKMFCYNVRNSVSISLRSVQIK